MMVDGGWICRACWKANRPDDERCYRCKTPRDADDAAVAARQAASAEQRASETHSGFQEILLGLPAWVFNRFWRLYVLGGLLFLGVAVLAALDDEAPALGWLLFAGAAVGLFVLGAVMWWASGAMRARNPLAYLAALVVSVGIGGFAFWALNTLPEGSGNPGPMRYVTIAIFGSTALLALVGLVLSLGADEPS